MTREVASESKTDWGTYFMELEMVLPERRRGNLDARYFPAGRNPAQLLRQRDQLAKDSLGDFHQAMR